MKCSPRIANEMARGNAPRPAPGGDPQEPPEPAPPWAEHAEPPHGAGKRPERPGAEWTAGRRRELEVQLAAAEVGLRREERGQELPVPGDERLVPHGRLEVGPIELVAVRRGPEPPLSLEPPPERGPRQRHQHADHRARDGQRRHEGPLPLERGRVVAVEPDDEAGEHLQPGPGERPDGLARLDLQVLLLPGPRQRRRVGGLEPHEHGREAGVHHGGRQRRLGRQVEARLGVQVEGLPVRALPGGHLGHEPRGRAGGSR